MAIMAPAWVLDAAVCSALSVGYPLVCTAALEELHRVLGALGFRLGFVDEETTKDEAREPHPGQPITDHELYSGVGKIVLGPQDQHLEHRHKIEWRATAR